jgi:DNA polymerase
LKREGVFDILNAGPRNRFVILTTDGPLIVHNSGYQGGPGAWKAFGADKFLTDQEIQQGVTAWREASPSVVAFWRGVEAAAIQAVRTGVRHSFRSISYEVIGKVLYCNLPSGRRLSYHNPIVIPDTTPWGKDCFKLTHMVNLTTGGWQRDNTYGGKLTENIVQAVARDLLAYAMVNLEKAGYPVVMHIHDEIVCELPRGWGSVEEMEKIMGTMPPWAHDWPIRAAGGWRGERYRK